MLEPSAQSGSNLLAMLLQHRGDDDADDDAGFPSPEVPTADLLGIEDPSDGNRQDAAIKRTLSRAKQAAVRTCPKQRRPARSAYSADQVLSLPRFHG